jgi:hypothetical protein
MVLHACGRPTSGDSLFNDRPFGTFDAWSGRRPPHQSRPFGRQPPTTDHRRRSADIFRAGRHVSKVPHSDLLDLTNESLAKALTVSRDSADRRVWKMDWQNED